MSKKLKKKHVRKFFADMYQHVGMHADARHEDMFEHEQVQTILTVLYLLTCKPHEMTAIENYKLNRGLHILSTIKFNEGGN